MRIARFRCPVLRKTFSLLPDFLSCRLSGLLDEVEQVVATVESARSVEAAADALRPDIELAGAVRWVRRRLMPVRAVLVILVTLAPELLGCAPSVGAVRAQLSTDQALMKLRDVGQRQLQQLVHPVGLLPP